MHSSIVHFLFATGVGLAAAAPCPQYQNGTARLGAVNMPNEIVYLARCDKTEDDKVTQTKDQLFYGADATALKNHGKPDAVGAPVDPQGPVPDLGHIDWTRGTFAKPINGTIGGREFAVWNLDSNAEIGQTTGAGELDGVDFRCYREDPSTVIARNSNGLVCKSEYSCTQGVREIRRTELRLWNQTVNVPSGRFSSEPQAVAALADPASVFANLRPIIDERQGKRSFYLSPTCSVTFEVSVPEKTSDPNYIENIGSVVADYFVKEVAPIVKDSAFTSQGTSGGITGSIPWYNRVYTYPRGGRLAVQKANQVNPMWDDQYYFDFSIECHQECGAPVNQILRAIAGTSTGLGTIVADAAAKSFFGRITSIFTVGTAFGKC